MKFIISRIPHFFNVFSINAIFSFLVTWIMAKLFGNYTINGISLRLFAHFISSSQQKQKQQLSQKHVIPRINNFTRSKFLLTRVGFEGTTARKSGYNSTNTYAYVPHIHRCANTLAMKRCSKLQLLAVVAFRYQLHDIIS